ncbi:hypothetical protein GWI33_014714 [Rhynchophorus ferrugineus]|uniref:Uncharacterized protein n=1 Tax=Rhynchophorus ferrugineus TaxID=354439 RepID=A0A834IEL8_RHYFE|nr:hypothetical protein GWI33_014714 [Rhynchophorus ferrugineus]
MWRAFSDRGSGPSPVERRSGGGGAGGGIKIARGRPMGTSGTKAARAECPRPFTPRVPCPETQLSCLPENDDVADGLPNAGPASANPALQAHLTQGVYPSLALIFYNIFSLYILYTVARLIILTSHKKSR